MRRAWRTNFPRPLPAGLLSRLAAKGLGLFLDYDGTLAEIVSDPAKAAPLPGVPETIAKIAGSKAPVAVAIVTGRRLREVRRLLRIRPDIFYSGVHGMELCDRNGKASFTASALACSSELARVRRWLKRNVPARRGFRIEDKTVAIGLHYRLADPAEAESLCARFADFVASETPQLKIMKLKMLYEAMPRAAGKHRAIGSLKRTIPRSWAIVYIGDDTTDEDAFAALGKNGIGILAGPRRKSRARYRVAGPRAVARELRALAASIEQWTRRQTPRAKNSAR
ncbi:MAG: trehalose-phosphatase [Candidatus Binataceae bacterium]